MPRSTNSTNNAALLEAALAGLEAQKTRVEEQIDEVRRMLGGGARQRRPAEKRAAKTASAPTKPKRPPLSPAAIERISAAQRKRWAAYRKEKKGGRVAETT